MPITTLTLATAGSAADLVTQVKSGMASGAYPSGSLVGVHATVGGKVEYFQATGPGANSVNDYNIVVANDRAEFTAKTNSLLSSGWVLLGDPAVTQLGPGRTTQYAIALIKTNPT